MTLWALCGACFAVDASALLCPTAKGEKKTEQKKAAALAKSLKEINKGIDIQDKSGQTALMVAAALDNRLAVAYLIALGADTMRTDKSGKTALNYAISAPVRELLSICKESNATVLHEDKQKQLRELGLEDPAVRMEHVKSLVQSNKLKELANVLKLGVELGAESTPALHSFFTDITPEMLALLVRRGYNLNTPDETSKKVALPGNVNAAKLALALEQQPADSDENNLAVAILQNDVKAVKALLKGKPDLAKSAGIGALCPMSLAQSGDMVHVLHEAGAELNDTMVDNSLQIRAVGNIIGRQSAGAREAEVIQACIECGWKEASDGGTLLILCTEGSADARTAQCLLQAGAKLGSTELHYAAARGKTATVKTLLEHKADPNALDQNGESPLLFLLQNSAKLNPSGAGLPETIKALIKGGANPKLKTKDGQNALQLAKSLGRDDLAKIIKSAAK